MRKVLWAVFVVAACGGGSGGSVPLNAAPDDLHRALCDWLARCGEVPDAASCISGNIGLTFRLNPSEQAAVDMGKIKYDAAKMSACISTYENRSCDSTSESFRGFLSGGECIGIFSGTVADGGECATNLECISNVCNIPTCTMQCCTGTCMGNTPPAAPAAIGQPCSTNSTSGQCVSGAFCDFSTATATCAALKAQGAACMSDDECNFGLACTGTTTQTCNPLPTLGAACPDARCRDLGTTCVAGTCAKVSTLNGPCTGSSQCQAIYTCNGTTCADKTAIGGACTSTSDCAEYKAFCSNASTCTLPQANGAMCSTGSQCQTDFCDQTTSLCAAAVTCI